MRILPALDEAAKIAAAGEYKVLPVSCEILSDFITPIEAMRILKNVSTHCYMLESAQANETWGRYTFLGFEPKMEITCIEGVMEIGDPPVISAGFLRITKARVLITFPLLRAGLWVTFLTIISVTASHPSSVMWRMRRLLRMLT